MRDRVKDYHIYATSSQVVVRLLTIPNDVVLEEVEGELTPASTRRVIEAIRLIVDETIGEVFCSSMQKNKIRKVYGSGTSMGVTAACAIEFAQPEGKTANTTDQFTIELDWGDETAKESTLTSAKEEILAESEAIKQAIADKPEVDLSGVAKEKTNESILSALNGIASTMYKGVPIVSQTTDATIAPNVWNVWGEVAALTITKGAEVSGVVNSYLIRFVAAEGCAITFDGFALNWYGGSVPTWNAGSTYEINIVDNLALWAEFTPSAS